MRLPPMASTQVVPTPPTPAELASVKLLYVRTLAGVVEAAKSLRAVEAELNRLGQQPANVVPIARQKLTQARQQYRNILARLSGAASAMGIVLPIERILSTATLDGDVGAVTAETFGGGKEGQERLDRMRSDILSGGIAPGGGIIIMGEEFALKVIAKVGRRKAGTLGATFARGALAASKVAGTAMFRAGGRVLTAAVTTAVVGAIAWFSAATAIRIAGPALGKGLGNLLSTPGGIVLGALAIYLIIGKGR